MARRPLRFVLAFQPGRGHWARMSGIAAVLRQRGHEISLATSASFRNQVDECGSRFIPIGPRWREDELATSPARERSSLVEALRRHSSTIASYFYGGAPKAAADLQRALRADRPDLLVGDYTMLAAAPTAEALGIPWATIFGLSISFSLEGWPPFGSELPYTRAPARRRDYARIEKEILAENRKLYAPVRRLWRQAGLDVADPWRAYADPVHLGIVGSIRECEFPHADDLKNIHYVGPLLDAAADAGEIDRETAAFIDASREFPLVHVTLGTTYGGADILRRIVDALRRRPIRLLVACGLADVDALRRHLDSPGRMLFRRSFPHARIMDKLDALICHGGANTLMKALHHGVPTLNIPLGAEQRSNAARFEYSGLGKMILPTQLSPAAIRGAVKALLDPRGRCARTARRLAAQARRAGGARRAALLLEKTAQRGRPA